jgi:malonate transporter
MKAVFDIVIPVFSIVILSFGLARCGVFNAATSDGITRLMFYVAIPAMLFRTLATTTLPQEIPWSYIFAFYGASFAMFVGGAFLSARVFQCNKSEQGIAAISASYSNMVMLGFPLIITTFGEDGAVPLFILLALQSMLLFPATTWMLEVYGRDTSIRQASIFGTVAKLLFNPVIFSLGLGIAANLTGVAVTGIPGQIISMLSAAAPACALVALGAGLAQYDLRGDLKLALMLSLCKGFVHPALVWIACWLLHVPVLWTQVAVVLAAMPTGINAFIFARNYEVNVAVVSKTIVLSTLLSTITVSVLLHRFL